MKQIENIFSKTKTTKETSCPNPKIPIIIDTREKQSLIAANLLEKKANIQFEKLEIGDYLIEDTIIERKTFQDFVGSMINKRLLTQIREIKKYPKHFLILEGFYYNYNEFNVHENTIRGMLLSIATDFQVPTIFTENEEDTANFLILLAKKYEKPKTQNATRQTKTLKTPEEQKQFILEGFPGIGPAAAKQLLKNFPTLQTIFNTTEEQLKQIGLNENKTKKFLDILNKKIYHTSL
jgi:Fanconi anemia group M protein